jgi:3-oxoacyl-[acyl-carrier protein] reductase
MSPGRRILLIGGTGAIGARLAERLAADGHVVAPAGAAAGGAARAVDVRDPASVESLVSAVEREVGAIDVLINAAAISVDAPVPLLAASDWQRVLDVDLGGVYHAARAVARRMIPRRGGQIVHFASGLALAGIAGASAYAAAKAGVIGFSRSLARELAPSGIAVHVICPGWVPSRLSGGEVRAEQERRRALLDPRHNLDDVAEFVAFLCAGRLRGVTGQVFHLDSRVQGDA